MCRKAKVTYLASVWEEDSLNWIDKYLKFYKLDGRLNSLSNFN